MGVFNSIEKWLKNELKYLIDNYLNEDAIVQTKSSTKILFQISLKNSTVVKIIYIIDCGI